MQLVYDCKNIQSENGSSPGSLKTQLLLAVQFKYSRQKDNVTNFVILKIKHIIKYSSADSRRAVVSYWRKYVH